MMATPASTSRLRKASYVLIEPHHQRVVGAFGEDKVKRLVGLGKSFPVGARRLHVPQRLAHSVEIVRRGVHRR
jgi:hypothetical protein